MSYVSQLQPGDLITLRFRNFKDRASFLDDLVEKYAHIDYALPGDNSVIIPKADLADAETIIKNLSVRVDKGDVGALAKLSEKQFAQYQSRRTRISVRRKTKDEVLKELREKYGD